MNIIVVSKVEWNNQNSSGNTFSNFFEGWTDAVFMNIYARESNPDNIVCKKYYKIPVLSIIKNFFCPWKIGTYFCVDKEYKEKSSVNYDESTEKRLIMLSKSINLRWLYLLDDLLYSTRIWMNNKYKKAISDFNPDIIFYEARLESSVYQHVKYLKKHTKAKLVGFVMDDVYGAALKQGGIYGFLKKKRCKAYGKMSDKLYGISDKLCEVYGAMLDRHFETLQKGCELTTPKTFVNSPIRINYAGNLSYERYKSLAALANAIKEVNRDGIKVVLHIYTGSNITPEIDKLLNIRDCSKIYAKVSYNEIKKIQRSSDIILHVESFSPSEIEIVRYSFSTKITDCLQAGTAMMVIGPEGISPIEEPRKIPGVIVVNDINELPGLINNIVRNREEIVVRAKKIYDYAIKHFQIEEVRRKLKSDFDNLKML